MQPSETEPYAVDMPQTNKKEARSRRTGAVQERENRDEQSGIESRADGL